MRQASPPSSTPATDAAAGTGRPRAANLADLVRAAAGRSPARPALLEGERVTTWGALDAAVDAAAAGLRELGLEPGDRVAIMLGNTTDFPVAYFGVLRAGLVALPVNTAYTPAEATHLLADSGARAIVVEGPGVAGALTLREEVATLETVIVSGGAGAGAAEAAEAYGAVDFGDLLARHAGARPQACGGGEDLAVLLYTSGTSGKPKGAMLSHRALLADLEHVTRISPPVVRPDDVVLLVLPLFHVYGLNSGLGMLARHGATGVLVRRFEPVETLETVRRRQITVIVGAPPMYVAWSLLPDVAEAFATVRIANSGAAPLSASVLRRMQAATGGQVFEGYGLTETAPTVTSSLMSARVKPHSIGRPVPGVEVRLLDGAGAEVDEDDPGEIVVRGANLFSGYWPDGAGGPDAEGWYRTGDVAYADEDGDLHLVDRRTDLVLVSGFNVYPREVEDVLVTHPGVLEAAVIGVPHPYTGEAVKAFVVAAPGAVPSAPDVVAHAASSLARFKCPTIVEFVTALPHSSIGKVAKGQLRAAAREGGGGWGRP